MANEVNILILRDNEGNTYALNAETVRAAKVPADKVSELRAGIQDQDVAGFFFNTNFLNSFNPTAQTANLNQNQQQNAQNVAGGAFVFVGAQAAQNIGVQGGGINQNRA